MHELSLFAYIPGDQLVQLIEVLTGLCAMQPRTIFERRILCRPTKIAEPTSQQIGGSQAIQHQKAVQPAQQQHLQTLHQHLVQQQSTSTLRQSTQPWVEVISDLPEPALKSHISRRIEIAPKTIADPVIWLKENDYKVVQEFVRVGHQFTWDNVELLAYQDMMYSSSLPDSVAPLPQASEMRAIDTSNGHVFRATVRLADGSDPVLKQQGQQDLDRLKSRLGGVVGLRAPERLSLDTRIR